MISLAVHPDRLGAAKEFFELFKTAWKPYVAGEPCTVLITDGTAGQDADSVLSIVFSPDRQAIDPDSGAPEFLSGSGVSMQTTYGSVFPVYAAHRYFNGTEHALMADSTGRVTAFKKGVGGRQIVRVGYDLFDEVEFLLSKGQPVEQASIPTLDLQIDFVRRCILDAGLAVVEIPPCPAQHPYMVCLTHDVDFVSIRSYGVGRTFQGFVKRALIGSFRRVCRGSLSLRGLLKNYAAVLSIPAIHLGLGRDFWMQFDAYRKLEEPNRSTFFLIPFKDCPGEEITEPRPCLRAARYDVRDVRDEAIRLQEGGWEMGVHGIDAWRDAEAGHAERERVSSVLGGSVSGVRTHWLCCDAQSFRSMEKAGFEYDSTCGYNETIGFRAGTAQVFRPLDVDRLLEVPLHIQDVALFYPAFLGLDEKTAWKRTDAVIRACRKTSGVLTVLWHMRSLAPERQWGGFYQRLLARFRHERAWLGTAAEVVDWFRQRREVRLSQRIGENGEVIIVFEGVPGRLMPVRIYQPVSFSESSRPRFSDEIGDGFTEIRTGFYTTSNRGSFTGGAAV